MRLWNRQTAYEDRHRAAGLCTRCPNPRSPRSKNLCASCLKKQRLQVLRLRTAAQPAGRMLDVYRKGSSTRGVKLSFYFLGLRVVELVGIVVVTP